jgi:hypothetical protein
MKIGKAISKYIGPVIILLLLVSLLIYASIQEGFTDCACPAGSELRNGGCYSCEKTYKLSTDYYNSFCVNESGGIKAAIYKKISC